MKTKIVTMFAAASLALGVSVASASSISLIGMHPTLVAAPTIDLFEFHAASDATSAGGNLGATGLGTYTFHYTTAGSHYGGIYLDNEINEWGNTFFNEYGAAHGASPAGLKWEIDEPGFGTTYTGDIYDHFVAGTLDNKIFNNTKNGPEDVAMAMLWYFTLGAGQSADLTFTASTTAPAGGFYLAQYDGPLGEDPIYLSGQLRPTDEPRETPEPSTVLLLGGGLAGLFAYRRRKSA